MEAGFMVHANADLPGGFKSRVASKDTAKGIEFYHAVQDETTGDHKYYREADYTVVNSREHGVYRLYRSHKTSDFDEYMKRHRSAVLTWMELYMTDTTGTTEEAGMLAETNRRAYEGQKAS